MQQAGAFQQFNTLQRVDAMRTHSIMIAEHGCSVQA
jgi:hypothetical protein